MGITTTQILDLFSKNYTFGSSGIVKTHTHPKTQVHDMFLLILQVPSRLLLQRRGQGLGLGARDGTGFIQVGDAEDFDQPPHYRVLNATHGLATHPPRYI